jgi:hypothetical protein
MSAPTETCPGRLVVHIGGRVELCTDAHEGRPCPGLDPTHAGGEELCLRKTHGDACAICDAEPKVPDLQD